MIDKRRLKNIKIFLFVFLGLLIAALVYIYLNTHATTLNPEKSTELLANPMIGLVSSADYPELVQDSTLKSTLVYVDVTWREFEPQKGMYDFDSIDKNNYLANWRAQGKRVVFRFICDIPGDEQHMDIPDWLYEETGEDGDWYDTDYGKGYSPNYNNEKFIQYHKLAIEALGKRYGKDDFFCYIELGSLGHWGEWHVKYDDGIKRMPLETVREQYIEPYIESFPNAMFLMRRPFKAVQEHQFGVYNDMTALPEDTNVWLDWIKNGGEYDATGEQNGLVAMPDVWKSAPVGGEFTSAISMKEILVDDIEVTKSLIEQSHMSFIGPQIPEGDELQYTDGIEAVQSLLGYRLRITDAVLTQSPLYKDLQVSLNWINDGQTPFYKNWEVYLYFFNSDGKETLKMPVNIKLNTIVDDAVVKSLNEVPINDLPQGTYQVGIAIIDPLTKKPGVAFAMENTRADNIFILGQWKKE